MGAAIKFNQIHSVEMNHQQDHQKHRKEASIAGMKMTKPRCSQSLFCAERKSETPRADAVGVGGVWLERRVEEGGGSV